MRTKPMAIEPAGREVSMLLDSAEQEFPGVIELVKAYGNYEETISLVQQYLNMGNEDLDIVDLLFRGERSYFEMAFPPNSINSLDFSAYFKYRA